MCKDKKVTPANENRGRLKKNERLQNEVNKMNDSSREAGDDKKSMEKKFPPECPIRFLRSSYCLIWEKGRFRMVPLERICYLEADRSYCKVHFDSDKSMLISGCLDRNSAELPEKDFVRVSKHHMVNLKQVEFLDGNTFILYNGQPITIGKKYRKKVYASLSFLGTRSKKFKSQ